MAEWLDGASTSEYQSSGHELDAFSVSAEGVSIYCEIIWSGSKTHFLYDLNLLQQSDADVKIAIGGPDVISNPYCMREFSKLAISQRRRGNIICSRLVDGSRLLTDADFLNETFKRNLIGLVRRAERANPSLNSRSVQLALHEKTKLKSAFRSYAQAIEDSYNDFEAIQRKGRIPVIEQLSRFNLKQHFVSLFARDLANYRLDEAESMVEKWLTSGKQRGLLLLGDYGTGKTSLCTHLICRLAISYIRRGGRIPIFVSLKNVETVSAQSIVECVARSGLRSDWNTLSELSKQGKLLFLLDGFDEMVKKTDWERTLRDFQSIIQLFCQGRAKVIVTCRTHYFLKDSDIWGEDTALMERLRATQDFRIVSLEPFGPNQVLEFLSRRVPNPQEIWQKIRETYNLADLCKRPLLIELVVTSLPDLVASGRNIDPFGLYDTYTGIWIGREDWRSQLKPAQKSELMEELAVEIFSENLESIPYPEIRRLIETRFRAKPTAEASDYFDYDIRTCSFFSRDREGNYSFMHRSFMEFFIAKKIVRELRNWTVSEALSAMPLTQETAKFAAPVMTIQSKEFLFELLKKIKGKSTRKAGIIGGNALTLLKESGESTLINRDLSSCPIWHADLHSLRLEKCNLKRARLEDVDLSASQISDCSLEHTHLLQSKFVGAKITNVTLSYSEVNGSDFTNAELSTCCGSKPTLGGCSFFKAKLTSCNLPEIRIDKSHFDESTFVDTSLNAGRVTNSSFSRTAHYRTSLKRSRFRDCNWSGAAIIDSDLSKAQFRSCSFSFANFDKSILNDVSIGRRFFHTNMDGAKRRSTRVDATLLRPRTRVLHVVGLRAGHVFARADPNLRAYCMLDSAVADIGLSVSTEENTIRLFSSLKESDFLADRIASMAACLYAVCKTSRTPIGLKRVARSFTEEPVFHGRSWNVSPARLGRKYRLLLQRDYAPRVSLSPRGCVDVLAKRIKFSPKTVRLAKQIAGGAKPTSGLNPFTIAASALYLAAGVNKEKVTQASLAEAADLTVVTIGKGCSLLSRISPYAPCLNSA